MVLGDPDAGPPVDRGTLLMAGALRARVVRRVDREEMKARDRAHSHFAGWKCVAAVAALVLRCARLW